MKNSKKSSPSKTSIPEPKWLNRRPIDPGIGLEDVIVPHAIVDEKKHRKPWLFFFLLFLLAGVSAIVPIAIIFTDEVDTPINKPGPSPGPNPGEPTNPIDPVEPIVPITETELSKFNFSLKGWKPKEGANHHYLLNRPDDPTNDDFKRETLSIPSSKNDSRTRTELQTTLNQNISSEYYSYSLDLTKKAACESQLLEELERRSNLDSDDEEKINVPTGYSLNSLFNRIKGTYCTFFKSTRNNLINEIKAPYITNPDKTIMNENGTPMVNDADSEWIYRGAWYEHDAAELGKPLRRYTTASDFPDKYRYRYKTAWPGYDEGSKLGDSGYDNTNLFSAGLLQDDRAGYNFDFFYRYIINAGYSDIYPFYEERPLDVINRGGQMFKRTLTDPGRGPNNAWSPTYDRDYSGDVGFSRTSTSSTDSPLKTYKGNSIAEAGKNLLVVDPSYPSNKEFYTLWNGADSRLTIPTNFLYAIESQNTGYHFNLNIQEESKPADFLTYTLRSIFDNSRNRSLNDTFKDSQEGPISNTSRPELYWRYDAATNGRKDGLGTFSYESTTLGNVDRRVFEDNVFETTLSNECLSPLDGSFVDSACPETKETILDTNKTSRSVYVPTKNNSGTEYYAKLLEINELWDFLGNSLEDILKNPKYSRSSFDAVNNFFDGDSGAVQSIIEKRESFNDFFDSGTKDGVFNSDNFSIFFALVDLFADENINRKFKVLNNDDTIAQSTELFNKAYSDALALASLKTTNKTISLSYNKISDLFSNFILSLGKLIDYKVSAEVDRKLSAEYVLSATNSDRNSFKYSIEGRKLPYLHYVRLMKIAEAKKLYGETTFDIYKWGQNPPVWPIDTGADYIRNNGGVDRTVTLSNASDSEAAYFIIHHLKDSAFPWIPFDYKNVETNLISDANRLGISDISMGKYTEKFDSYIEDAETYVNNYMNNYYVQREGVTKRVADAAEGKDVWRDFDVAKTDGSDDTNVIAKYAKGLLFQNRVTFKSSLFGKFKNTQISISDLMYYTEAHYFKKDTVTTHCLTTYETTEEQKQDPGYGYVGLPTLDPSSQDDPNKLLSYVKIPEPGSAEERRPDPTHFEGVIGRNIKWQSILETFIDAEGKEATRFKYETSVKVPFGSTQISKLIHVFFSTCIENDQYNKPLEENSIDYRTSYDEWEEFTQDYDLKIEWDLNLDKTQA